MNALIIAPLIVAAISAILGFIISLADDKLNDYGIVKININKGKKEVEVKGGSTLLNTMATQDIFIPSACGGKGSCAACKVQILSDIGQHLPTETPHMSPQELKENIRLACQIKVKTNLDLQVPEELFSIKKFVGIVEKIEEMTHDIKRVYIRLPEGMTIDFVAGNYAQFEVPPYFKEYHKLVKDNALEARFDPKTYNHPAITVNPGFSNEIKQSSQKAYSISSDPNDVNHLEFMIRLVPGGLVTTYVHTILKENMTINMLAPMGEFHVHYDTLKANNGVMICVGGGSGMAPFKGIFFEMIKNTEINNIPIWYFFGAATPKDMYYTDWLESLHQKYEHFHFIPALSGPPPFPKPADWTPPEEWDKELQERLNSKLSDFEVGLITDIMDKYLKDNGRDDRNKGHKIKDAYRHGYLCGSSGMLNACMKVMTANGMKEDEVYFDKFN